MGIPMKAMKAEVLTATLVCSACLNPILCRRGVSVALFPRMHALIEITVEMSLLLSLPRCGAEQLSLAEVARIRRETRGGPENMRREGEREGCTLDRGLTPARACAFTAASRIHDAEWLSLFSEGKKDWEKRG